MASEVIYDPHAVGSATPVAANAPREANYLVVVGNPIHEKPNCNLDRVHLVKKKYPAKTLLIIVWDKADYDQLSMAGIATDTCVICHWTDDGKMTSYLLDNIHKVIGAQIIQVTWWECAEGHATRSNKDASVVHECATCGKPVTCIQPYRDKHQEFANLFIKVWQLVDFDTRSGESLRGGVNPIANMLRNMKYAWGCDHVPTVDAESLRGTGKGKAAILISAGPSLENDLPHIKRVQDRCVISCVGRSFKKLREEGIRVDYTISVEMFDWDSAIFDEVTPEMAGNTLLCFASVCAPATLAKWPGRKCCLWDVESALMLGRKDWIFGGNSISHHQLNFAAQILECEPIILVGNDLSYTTLKTHADGTAHANWPEAMRRYDELPHHMEKWVPCTAAEGSLYHPQCHMTPVGGNKIYVRSSPAYECFATLFGILISRHGKRVFNACPNGQLITGAEYLNLKEWEP